MDRYKKEAREWDQIAQELGRAGTVTAFDVSEEQRRRMAARGERPMTYDEVLAEAALAPATEK